MKTRKDSIEKRSLVGRFHLLAPPAGTPADDGCPRANWASQGRLFGCIAILVLLLVSVRGFAETPASAPANETPCLPGPAPDVSAVAEALVRIDRKLEAVDMLRQLLTSAAMAPRIGELIRDDPTSRDEMKRLAGQLRASGATHDEAMRLAEHKIAVVKLAELLIIGDPTTLRLLHAIKDELHLMNAALASVPVIATEIAMMSKEGSSHKEYRPITPRMRVLEDVADPFYEYFSGVFGYWYAPAPAASARAEK